MSGKYKSLYEKFLTELDKEGKIKELSPEKNIQILQELNEGMEEFVNDQKVKKLHSELELSGIVLI